jgi:hypothetical protein
VPDEVVPLTDAIRFSYALDGGGGLAVADAAPVAITALPSDDLDFDQAPFTGFWFELRDVDGNVLWRHVTGHPLRGTVEVYGDDAAGEPSMGLLPDEVGAPFATIAIPALDGADSVVLMGAPVAEPDGEVVELLVHRFEIFVV